MNNAHYAMLIQWSDEDQAFLVSFPDWVGYIAQPVTHGDTYEEAGRKGQEVLENLIGTAHNEGVPLPPARVHVA